MGVGVDAIRETLTKQSGSEQRMMREKPVLATFNKHLLN